LYSLNVFFDIRTKIHKILSCKILYKILLFGELGAHVFVFDDNVK
jgi:hypothetical protein